MSMSWHWSRRDVTFSFRYLARKIVVIVVKCSLKLMFVRTHNTAKNKTFGLVQSSISFLISLLEVEYVGYLDVSLLLFINVSRSFFNVALQNILLSRVISLRVRGKCCRVNCVELDRIGFVFVWVLRSKYAQSLLWRLLASFQTFPSEWGVLHVITTQLFLCDFTECLVELIVLRWIELALDLFWFWHSNMPKIFFDVFLCRFKHFPANDVSCVLSQPVRWRDTTLMVPVNNYQILLVVISNWWRVLTLSQLQLLAITTPHVTERDVTSLTNTVYANIVGIPFPFIGVDNTNACNNLFEADGNTKASCPLKGGKQYEYRNSFGVLEIYPRVSLGVGTRCLGTKKERIS